MSDFLNDPHGNNSSTRLVMFLWSMVVLIVWVGACIYKREMIDIPMGVGAILAYAFGAKVAQSVFGEKGKQDGGDK